MLGRRRLARAGRARSPSSRRGWASGPAGSPWITGCSRGRPGRRRGSPAQLAGWAWAGGRRAGHGRRAGRPGGGRADRQVPGAGCRPAGLRARQRCCSAIPGTIRPRPCCSGWPAGRGAARWRGCPSAPGATGVPSWPRPGPDRGRRARRWACRPGRIRTTPTPVRQVTGASSRPAGAGGGARPGVAEALARHRRAAPGRC